MKKGKKFDSKLKNSSKGFFVAIVFKILIVTSIFIIQSCSNDLETAVETKSEFSVNFLKENEKKMAMLFEQRRVITLSNNVSKDMSFNPERLQDLLNKSLLNAGEENELSYYLNEIGFQNREDFISFQLEVEQLGKFLVQETTINNLSREEIDTVLSEYLSQKKSNNLSFRSSCNNEAYNACEADVSASMAGDLLECAAAAAVTGLASGGLGGLIVGAACTANALYQATISSRACVRNHCPQQ